MNFSFSLFFKLINIDSKKIDIPAPPDNINTFDLPPHTAALHYKMVDTFWNSSGLKPQCGLCFKKIDHRQYLQHVQQCVWILFLFYFCLILIKIM